ncbi:MAG TPA: transglycosylase domain-containing protein [Acidimicrobiales bacterium]|nr:transglycosylase domain-containing protein [Acidimicrobiales bacterium]
MPAPTRSRSPDASPRAGALDDVTVRFDPEPRVWTARTVAVWMVQTTWLWCVGIALFSARVGRAGWPHLRRAAWASGRAAARFSVAADRATVAAARCAVRGAWRAGAAARRRGRACRDRRRAKRGATALEVARDAVWLAPGELSAVDGGSHLPLGGRSPRLLAVATVICLLLPVGMTRVDPASVLGSPASALVGVSGGDVTLPPLAQRSIVYAADGSVLAVLHGGQNRAPVTLGRISPIAVQAVIDTEDDRFWHHGGVDVRAMLRAAVGNARAGAVHQGGSTITQQLVKITLLSPERSLRRKLKEAVLAQRLEAKVGKRAVLERYLNTVYFGEGAYGVEAAAETYFGTTAADLDVPQSALLAGLIHSPDGDDPVKHPDRAKARRKEVLDGMVARRHLAPGDAAAAEAAPLPSGTTPPPAVHDQATDAVVQTLLADPKLGATVAERQRALDRGGLRIHTTVDPAAQTAAQAALDNGTKGVPPPLGAALVAIEPGTGAVRALVGGRDVPTGGFNPALVGRRQPGSTFKTFTLLAALEAGHRADEMIDGSSPCPIPNPGGSPNPWMPDNYEGEAFGQITLADATAHSVNCAYARLAHAVGPEKVVDVAHRVGISSDLPAVPAITLGTAAVTPLELAAGYATLAADGVRHPVHLVDRVERAGGQVVEARHDPGQRVVDPAVVREATAVLEGVIGSGTGTAATLDRPAAGKTGTAEHSTDAWFAGYTPQLATVVWMGDASGEKPMPRIGGSDVVGGGFPARIWRQFMADRLQGQPVVDFPPPPDPPPAPSTGATPGAPGPTTRVTTWCSASCGH